MSAPRVLILDDDHLMRNSLVDLIEAAGWSAKALARATEAQRWIDQFKPDVILSDVRMPEMSGLDFLRASSAAQPIVLISAHGDIPMAVEAMRHGAYSFVEKPYDPKRLLLILSHAADQFRMGRRNLRLQERLHQLSGLDRVLLGESAQMHRLRETIAMVSESTASVLIHGETGTGKDLVARALHDLSARCDGPYIKVGAAQLTAENLPHIARSAAQGTLFLDEICACPAPLQSMLLGLIETGEILNPGAGAPERADLRILSSTNEDAERAVSEGRLRRDLLYRLDGFALHLPPLRTRLDDVALLVQRFVRDCAELYEVAAPEMTDADLADLLAHDWPGNVRELRNVAERRVMMARHGGGTMKEALSRAEPDPAMRPGLREAVAAFERQMIGRAIQTCEGRMDEAAALLGIGRRTLNEKIVKLGLDKDALL
ncbi:sigma-54-dependent transcriptional regulator [Roseobacteraceae bacterium S113]